MASQTKNFISFVALGRPNPQILNIDFLRNNRILPRENEPNNKNSEQEKNVKKFVSVPGYANLVLENIEFIVDEGRFQITERSISEWNETKILQIAKRYFKVLPYTPLKVIGVNLNSTISFKNPEEAGRFQELLLPKDHLLAKIISVDTITSSIVLRYPYDTQKGRAMLTIDQPDRENKRRIINFNREFDFTNWKAFDTELDKISDVSTSADLIVDKLLKAL